MGFLTPLLFAAGAAAVALPILFHLIRRTPRGRIPFSTVMFLDSSPPTMTKRSRLEHWPLLLLRALALIALACAFGRPFLRQALDAKANDTAGVSTLMLIDTSASMQREDLWQQAMQRASAVIEAAGPADELAIYTFAETMEPVVSFEEWRSLDEAVRRETTQSRLAEKQPGWATTNTAGALMRTVDELSALTDDTKMRQSVQRIVLVSDLQSGSRLEALNTMDWPETIPVELQRVEPQRPANAGLELVNSEAGGEEFSQRVRVTSAADSVQEQFALGWQDDDGKATGKAVNVYVAPGRSRIVRLPKRPAGSNTTRLHLTGDDQDFDNRLFVVPSEPAQVFVFYYGVDAPDDPEGPRFYVQRAFPETPARRVEIIGGVPSDESIVRLTPDVRLAIATSAIEERHAAALANYVKGGGTLLFVGRTPDELKSVSQVFRDEQIQLAAAEAEVKDYAMLSALDFEHPVFAAFSEAQFADFTHIHVWKHRSIEPSSLGKHRILASFDDGDPAIIEKSLGRGRVLVFSSGWQPVDSQLALSTKFVPLLNSILELGTLDVDWQTNYAVGSRVPVWSIQPNRESANSKVLVRQPDGTELNVSEGEAFAATEQPGLYAVATPRGDARFAVNMHPDESDTAPLALEQLEGFGVKLKSSSENAVDAADAAEHAEQLHAFELERRQKLWQWAIVAAILFLFAETFLAARLARRSSEVAIESD